MNIQKSSRMSRKVESKFRFTLRIIVKRYLTNKRFIPIFIIAIIIITMQVSCIVPRLFWSQKDIQPYELNDPSLGKKVLVASFRSEFKNGIVNRIEKAFKDEPVYMKFIGIGKIKQEDASNYTVVVLINTCIAWSMDRHIKSFLKRHPKEQGKIIILTTSGDGNWLPNMKGRNFDAISSASKKVNIEVIADKIISRMQSKLEDF